MTDSPVWHPFTQHREWFDAGDPLIVERAEGTDLIDADGFRAAAVMAMGSW